MPRSALVTLLIVALIGVPLLIARRRAAPRPATFAPGDRVRVVEPGFWADRAQGTVRVPPPEVAALAGDWKGHVRMVPTTTGVRPFYWIALDELRRDADGDGPYLGAEISERALERLAPPPP